MELKISFLCLLIGASVFAVSHSAKSRDRNNKPYKVVCYHAGWAFWRNGTAQFRPEYIDAHACTHVVYAFAVLKNNKMVSHEPWQDLPAGEQGGHYGNYKKFVNLRQRNRHLTTLIAIGGWNEGFLEEDFKYSKMVADPAKRKIFVDSVVEFLIKYDFDGLDFDWEYPVLREGVSRPQDKENFILVLKELQEAFEPYGFMLTAAVAAGKSTMEAGYDIPRVNQYLDIINVMAYDFHGAFDSYTGHNSPMYARLDQSEEDKFKNLDYAVRHWIDGGADRKKITLGVPLYGRCHTLKDIKQNGYGAPSAGNGTKGHKTGQEGMLGYGELCLNAPSWTTVWDDCYLAPYMYRGDQWCSYDDEQSVKIKVEYVRAMDLGGAMVWSVDTDDFTGECSGRKNPLLTIIVDELESTKHAELPTLNPNCVRTSTDGNKPETTTSTTTTTEKPVITTTTTKKPVITTTTRKPTPTPNPSNTTKPPIPNYCSEPEGACTEEDLHKVCVRHGHFPMPDKCCECFRFIQCVANHLDYIPVVLNCGPNTAFNPTNSICDYKYNVKGCF